MSAQTVPSADDICESTLSVPLGKATATQIVWKTLRDTRFGLGNNAEISIDRISNDFLVIAPIPVKVNNRHGTDIVYEIPELALYAYSVEKKEAIKELRTELVLLCLDVFSLESGTMVSRQVLRWHRYLSDRVIPIKPRSKRPSFPEKFTASASV